MWEQIKEDVERVKLFGEPISAVIEEWGTSREWNQEEVLTDAIDSDLKGNPPETYEKLPVFLNRKVSELYEIRKLAGRPLVIRMVIGVVIIVVVSLGVYSLQFLF